MSGRGSKGSRPFPSCPYSPKCVVRLYEKSSNTGEPPRHEANHGSIYESLAARTGPLVVFAHPPVLLDPSVVRSTTHLLGNTKKPLGGNSLCQSTATPSLSHSLAHAKSTSSGAGFRGRSTRSTLNTGSSVPSLRHCPLLGSPRPTTDAVDGETARSPAAAAP